MLNSEELKKFNRLIDAEKYDRLPIIFNALGDGSRCRIVRILVNKGNSQPTVNDLAKLVGISASAVSQHLRILSITGLVVRERSGQRVYYRLNSDDPVVEALARSVL